MSHVSCHAPPGSRNRSSMAKASVLSGRFHHLAGLRSGSEGDGERLFRTWDRAIGLRSFRLLLVLIAWLCTAPSMSAASLTEELKPLLAGHCFDCHGPGTEEAELRLDTLSADLDDATLARTWEKVFDELSAREMPPQSEERPPEAILRSTIALLRKQLHQVSLARQQCEGRVLVRRLNNDEYENTLRDLLGINVPLKGPAKLHFYLRQNTCFVQ